MIDKNGESGESIICQIKAGTFSSKIAIPSHELAYLFQG